MSARDAAIALMAAPRRASRPPPPVGHADAVVAGGDVARRRATRAAEAVAEVGQEQRCRERDADHRGGDGLDGRSDALVESEQRAVAGTTSNRSQSDRRSGHARSADETHHSPRLVRRRADSRTGTGALVPADPGRAEVRTAAVRPIAGLLYSVGPRERSPRSANRRVQAIALRWRIGRPARRSSDQPNAVRRAIGGTTRETSIQLPGHPARGLFDSPSNPAGACQAARTKAAI